MEPGRFSSHPLKKWAESAPGRVAEGVVRAKQGVFQKKESAKKSIQTKMQKIGEKTTARARELKTKAKALDPTSWEGLSKSIITGKGDS